MPAAPRRPAPLLIASSLLLGAAGCAVPGASPAPDLGGTSAPAAGATVGSTVPLAPRAPTSSVPPGTASAALAALHVGGRAPRTGYDRDLFGQPWSDVDRDGCDTRNDVLRRDLVGVVLDERTDGCVVLSGRLDDPYTGRALAFTRGAGTSGQVQVDHVVALSDAWQKGAQGWDAATREAFANDPLNLLAVHGPANAAKGDGDAATWLPPQRSTRCAYVARQVAVKTAYGAWVTVAERDAVARVLQACPEEPLPTVLTSATPPRRQGGGIARPDPRGGVATGETEPSPTTGTPPVTEPSPPPVGATVDEADPRFSTCGLVLEAGYGPYVRDVDPEYPWYRDGDRDGVVCED